MLRACTALVVVLVMSLGAMLQANDSKKKEPPKQVEGTVKAVESKSTEAPYLVVAVKEKQPTSQEDVLRDVEKDYRFAITGSTKILGLDGKPDNQGLKSLESGTRVRVEHKDGRAVEVKKLPAK